MTFWLAQWMLKKQGERFLRALIDTKAQVDEVTDRYVRVTLMQLRLQRAFEPYTRIFKLAWEIVRGRYWKSSSKVHGGADTASGGSAGAGGQPVAQYGYTVPGTSGFTGGSAGAGLAVSAATAQKYSQAFDDAGIVAGEVIAYRCWRLAPDGFLYSVYKSDFCWKPGEVVEGDAVGGDGVHGFKSIILACQYAGSTEGYVTGTVDLWGDVFEHERGYRASKAAVRSIDDSPHYDAKALRKLYGLNKRKKKGLPKPEA